jgi:uncharacterized RDD family membrane protein YckC
MAHDSLTAASATGVDVSLAIAGPGSRSYAFVIDWHIRFLVALAWFVCAALIVAGTLAPAPGKLAAPRFALAVLLPAFAIYFLYHPVLELAMHGRTPGKRMAGVRLVTRTGGVPSTGALLIRNVFRIIDSLPAFYVVGLVSCFVTAEHVRIGDLAAGTVLVVDHGEAVASLDQLGALARDARIDPAALDLAGELLRRWKDLDSERRAALAHTLIARIDPGADPGLLAALDGGALRARLEALVSRGPHAP